jgi:predicted peptidase
VNRVLGVSALLFCILGTGADLAHANSAADKDDLAFRKNVYTDKKGEKMPYRLYIPQGYDPQQKYPLIFWLHGAAARGTDNLAQISGGNEKGSHIWTMPENQSQFPAFVLAPQCPADQFWAEPEMNELTPQLQMALVVPVDLVRTMIKQLKKAGCQVRYSEYHKVGHDVWLKAFAEPDIVPWLAAKKRGP